jgi:8-oxo-dGTP pyrophosphatase MutT (NUDIX family)
VLRLLFRLIATWLHRIRRQFIFAFGRAAPGVHALAFTPEGRLVLVRLRYAPGWRVPGGGRKTDEEPLEAIIRELREEIGLATFKSVRAAGFATDVPETKGIEAELFIVTGVHYKPRWSFEVEAVLEADLDRLPDDLAPLTRRWIKTALASA